MKREELQQMLLKAPFDALVFTMRAYPIVYQGSLIARLLRMGGGDA